MLSHVFSHGGTTYVVSFQQVESRWRATLYRHGDRYERLLAPLHEEAAGAFSDEAIRAGYIAVARWVVGGGWPVPAEPEPAVAVTPEAAAPERKPLVVQPSWRKRAGPTHQPLLPEWVPA